MTDEEAIKEFNSLMNYIGAHPAKAKDGDWDVQDACILAISALRDRIAREKPKPLTLDELREMVDAGEWAWVEMNYGTEGWCKPFQKHPFSMKNVDGGYITGLDFERGFVLAAYRRKPEPEGRESDG